MTVNRSCSHQVPLLVQPLQWSCRQIRNIFILKGCAAKTAQFGKTFFALLIIIPSGVIAIIGIGFKVIRNKPEKVCNLCFPPKKETTPKPVSTPPKNDKPSTTSTPQQSSSVQTPSSTQQNTPAQTSGSPEIQLVFTGSHKFRRVVTKEQLEKLYVDLFTIKDFKGLYAAASYFFDNYDVQTKPTLKKDFSYLGKNASDNDILHAIFQYEGYGVGEIHDNHAAKIFFMKHIPVMQEYGVRVLLFEGIDYFDQPLLDKWHRNELLTSRERSRLHQIFKEVANFEYSPEGNNDFTILLKARDWGMRIVGIDYPFSEEPYSSEKRRLMMNYVAYLVAQHELKGKQKYAALMGLGHLIKFAQYPKIPGFAELMGCPCLEVFDRKRGLPRIVAYNQMKSLDYSDAYLNPVTITIGGKAPTIKKAPEPKPDNKTPKPQAAGNAG